MTEAVLASDRAWPWGLCIVGDPDDHEQVPTKFGESQVLATVGSVVVKVQHEVDGPATVEVVLGDVTEHGLKPVHTGTMSLPSGGLLLTDAGREEQIRAHVPPGTYAVRVWVDEQPDPNRVVVALTGV